MTSRPIPDPDDLLAIAMTGLVHQMARAYVDGRSAAVRAADEQVRALSYADLDPGLGPVDGDAGRLREHLAMTGAELMFEEWSTREGNELPMAGVLAAGRRLAAEHAPPALRDDLGRAFDQIIAGQAEVYAANPAGLSGFSSAHLYAAATAGYVAELHPMVRNPALVVIEERIRKSQAVAKGMPAAEAVAYIPDTEVAALLDELLPWAADLTEERHTLTRMDMRALVRLYLLDHPVPTPEQKRDLLELIGAHLHDVGNALGQRIQRKTNPAGRLSPEEQARRRAAERQLRQRKKRR